VLTTLGSTEIYLSGRGSRLQRDQQGRVPRPSQGPAGAACYRVFSTLRNSCRKGLGGVRKCQLVRRAIYQNGLPVFAERRLSVDSPLGTTVGMFSPVRIPEIPYPPLPLYPRPPS